MSERMHALAQQIFGKSSVEECELQEIKDLVRRYPYFAPAQFLLLEKLKLEQSPEYNTQLQKAVLMYHNPLEFEYFISSDKFNTELEEPTEQEEFIPQVQQEFIPEVVHGPEEDVTLHEGLTENIPVEEASNEEFVQDEAVNELVPDPELLESFSSEVQDDLSAEPVLEKQEEEVLQDRQFSAGIVEEDFPEAEFESQATVKETRAPEPEIQLDAPETSPMEISETSLLKHQPFQTTNEQVPASAVAFEPFHTVDYFASQGIKLSQEEIPRDKFGKQLKSFTEWLKTMKRLPATEITAVVDPASESSVVHLAEDSVHDPNIVTEAMAEVWMKQGNRAKALEVYNKLSLLNPSKRAYFAGLIENLKRS